jgi:ankyrin repeat protein
MEPETKKTKFVYSVLHNAALNNDHELITNTLNNNIMLLNSVDQWNRTILQVACHHESIQAVDAILKFPGVDINNKDDDGYTALVYCWPDWQMASILLKYPDIDILVKDRTGQSIIFLFLQHVNTRGYINTPRSNIFKVVMLYLRLPAALLWRRSDEGNILHCIVSWNNVELLSAVFSVPHELMSKSDVNGNTPLDIACGVVGMSLYSDVMTRVKYLACLDMLLQNIDSNTLNKQNQCGTTAMHHACRLGNHIVVQKLLNLPEIDLTLYDDYGDTPLFDTIYASEHIFDNLKYTGITSHHKAWDLTCFRLLLEQNESLIFAKRKDNNRILHFAWRRLSRICNVPINNQNESLTHDFLEIIDELEVHMAKARWKIFQYMIRMD